MLQERDAGHRLRQRRPAGNERRRGCLRRLCLALADACKHVDMTATAITNESSHAGACHRRRGRGGPAAKRAACGQPCALRAAPAGLDGCSQKAVYVLKNDILTPANVFVSSEVFTMLLAEKQSKPVGAPLVFARPLGVGFA